MLKESKLGHLDLLKASMKEAVALPFIMERYLSSVRFPLANMATAAESSFGSLNLRAKWLLNMPEMCHDRKAGHQPHINAITLDITSRRSCFLMMMVIFVTVSCIWRRSTELVDSRSLIACEERS